MSFYVKVGSFAASTSAGNQSITGLGFQPKFVVLFGNNLTADGSATDAQMSFGIGVSSSDRRCMYTSYTNAASPTVCEVSQRDDCVYVRSVAGAVTVKANFISQDVDGFTINWSLPPASGLIINYFASGGTDFTGVQGGTLALPDGNPYSATGLPFRPSAIICFGAATSVANPLTAQQDALAYVGFQTGSGTDPIGEDGSHVSSLATVSGFSAYQLKHNVTVASSPTTSQIADAFGLSNPGFQGANGSGRTLAFFVFNNDGFTLSSPIAGATPTTVYYLALAGPQMGIGASLVATGGPHSLSGFGFAPQGGLFFGTTRTNQGGLSVFSCGAADATHQASILSFADGTTTGSQLLDRSNFLNVITPSGPSLANLTGFTSGGFSFTSTATSFTRGIFSTFLIGPAAVPGQPWVP